MKFNSVSGCGILKRYNKKTDRKAMSLMEILVSVAVIGLAFTLVSQMISSGTKNVGSSMWHSERLRESQLFFKMLREDLHKAADLVSVDYTVSNPANELTTTKKFITYSCPASENFPDPFSNVNAPVSLKVAKSTTASQTVISFMVSKLSKKTSSGTSSPGYQIQVKLNLENGKLYYIRQLQSGTPAPEDDESIIAAPGRVILTDVDFIHISHNDVLSEIYNPPRKIGSVINFFVRVKPKDDDYKKAEFKQSIKTSIEAVGL